jgi:hypothetical protein
MFAGSRQRVTFCLIGFVVLSSFDVFSKSEGAVFGSMALFP